MGSFVQSPLLKCLSVVCVFKITGGINVLGTSITSRCRRQRDKVPHGTSTDVNLRWCRFMITKITFFI